MLVADHHSARRRKAEAEQAARIRLAETGYLRLTEIHCSFRDGTMTLCGEVPSYYHKQLAQEVLRNVTDVTHVVNHIEVSSSL
jgi:osmotically-inducible protein OsmY